MKCVHSINVNVVGGCSYEEVFNTKFVVRKFYETKMTLKSVDISEKAPQISEYGLQSATNCVLSVHHACGLLTAPTLAVPKISCKHNSVVYFVVINIQYSLTLPQHSMQI